MAGGDMNRDKTSLKHRYDKHYLVKLILILLGCFSLIGSGLYFYTLHLSTQVTQRSAINSAEIYIKALEELRSLYTSEVVTTVKKEGILVTHDYQLIEGSIPLPATFSMLLGQRISQHDNGAKTSLYSPFPFPWRADEGGLKTDFSKQAWKFLSDNPKQPYIQFTEENGVQVLKYAKADVMRESCVACHNKHEYSPSKTWKTGDARGVLEVSLPLTDIVKYSQESLLGFFWLLLLISFVGILSICFFVIRMKKVSIKIEHNSQTKECLNALNDVMSGEQNISQMSQSILSYLAPILDAHQAAIFLAREDKAYTLTGSYALSRGENAKQKYVKGDGLIGQVIADENMIVVEEVPVDYLDLETGLGKTNPGMLVLYPVLFEGELLAVMELASLTRFAPHHFEFLDDIAHMVGIALKTTISREKTDELLILNQFQVMELKAQQEELGAVNNDLEEQARQLRESEEELKASEEELMQQSEQLRLNNVELEEKQESLKAQATELIASQKELEESAKELTQTSQYKSDFLANMSHELRTPLNSLLILSKILADNKQGNLTPEQVEEASIIHQGGQSLLELINDIMDLSKVEAGKLDLCFEAVSLINVGHNLEALFIPIANEKNIDFTISLHPSLPDLVQTDQKRVEQVLKNFLSNAFKFTKQGSVSLTIFPTEFNAEGAIGFTVADSGIGIPTSKQDMVFESFQQANGSTNREYGGTGLGLAISKELSALLNGEIQLESEEGKGSRFSLIIPDLEPDLSMRPVQECVEELPLVTATSVSDTWLDDDRDVLKPEHKSILVIEDDKSFSKILIDYARRLDFKVIATNQGEVGLGLANRYAPNGILLDIGLPDVDGLAILEALKSNAATRHIPVHVLSASDNKVASLHLGALNYLQKPISLDRIGNLLVSGDEHNDNHHKQILLVDDDQNSQVAIQHLIDNKEVNLICANNAEQAFDQLSKEHFDCIILDLGLPDTKGIEFVTQVSERVKDANTPIIIYTGQDLSAEEQKALQQLSISIVIKGSESPERLLDDVALFLNHIDEASSSVEENTLKMLHDENSMLKDRQVLVVDDDMRNVFAITRVLEQTGLIITQAENGQAAIDAVNSAEQTFDLILMDIMMPVMDGLEATRIIREMPAYRSTPIIALTAKAMPGDRQKCLDAGGSEYLIKPLDMDMLLSILRVWLYKPSQS